jgi:hypothetical protein
LVCESRPQPYEKDPCGDPWRRIGDVYTALEFEKGRDPDFEVTTVSEDNSLAANGNDFRFAVVRCCRKEFRVERLRHFPLARKFSG